MQHRPGPGHVAPTPIAQTAPPSSMKFHADKSEAQSITGYGPGWVAVDREKFEHSLLVGAKGLRQAWDCVRFEDLTPEHFEALSQLDAEVIIRSEEHTSELQSQSNLVCRLLLEKKKS